MSYFYSSLFTRIDEKTKVLQTLRPLPAIAIKKLKEQFELEMTYNSNAIEGNSLTLKETYLVLSEGITIKGKPFKDHLEAKDHHDALEFLYELVSPDAQPTISEQLIRSIHQLVVNKTEQEFAGRYRTSDVFIAGSKHRPPNALQLSHEMTQLMRWYQVQQGKLHPIELAAVLHHKLVAIHPFFDGNGRTARLVMNLVLLRAKYPLAVILKNDRQKYYRSLEAADNGEYLSLVRLVSQAVERSLDIYIKTLTPATTYTEVYKPLVEIKDGTPYSAKYLNLLVNKGKLEAHKVGRNWVSSKEALQRYIGKRERKR